MGPAKANTVLCAGCGRIHDRCADVKRDAKVLKKYCWQKMKRDIGQAVEQEEKFCDEMDTAREYTYLGDRVSTGRGCEAAVKVKGTKGGP